MKKEMTIGEQLRAEREKRGYSIDDVHQKLKIHPDALNRLENDNFTNSPGGGIYIKGFLKQYADFLGLNVQEILSEFSAVGVKPKSVEFSIGTQKSEDKGTDFRKFWLPIKRHQKEILKVLSWMGIFLAALIVSFLVLRTAGSLVHRISVNWNYHQQVKKENKALQQAAKPKKQVAKPAEAKSVSSPQAQAVTVPAEVINDGFLNSPARHNFPLISENDKLVLKIETITDVWMRVSADDEVLFERILKSNTSEEWMANKSFYIRFGRPEGALLTVNGEKIGKPGDGKVKAVTISRDGIKQA
ncbi:MAG: DUF4115 domain-containing protein [Candidatus Omnitrophica bacterium]|nr:DUF4115 domain-containing protein [Candidatus Omnitrophota bacterium]